MDIPSVLDRIAADAAHGDIVFPTHTEIALRVQRMLDDPDCAIDALGKRQVVATLVCGVVFALFPANLAFDRVLPDAQPYRTIFAWMFAIDQPHNLLPSLHIVYTVASGVAMVGTQWAKRRYGVCVALLLWAAAICASTLLVHQHHVLDVVAAVVLVGVLSLWIRVPRTA